MSTCPCCGDSLLRHVNHGSLYWFCPSCWQEMPNFDSILIANARAKLRKNSLSANLIPKKLESLGTA